MGQAPLVHGGKHAPTMPQPRSGPMHTSPLGQAGANGEATHGSLHTLPKYGMHALSAHSSVVLVGVQRW